MSPMVNMDTVDMDLVDMNVGNMIVVDNWTWTWCVFFQRNYIKQYCKELHLQTDLILEHLVLLEKGSKTRVTDLFRKGGDTPPFR